MSSGPLAALAAGAEDSAPFLTFLERSWSRRAIWQEAGAAAIGLRALGLAEERPIGILLPNLPGAVVALLAVWLAGGRAALVDPRRAMAQLHDWAETEQPAALVTLDLASVFERARALAEVGAPHQETCRLIVMPMASQLGLWKRLITPLLRGGGTAKRPEGLELVAWQSLLRQGGGPLPHPAADIPAPEPWPEQARALLACPLAEPAALKALVAAWCGAGQIILTPRLDERSLAKVRKAGKPDLEITAQLP